MSSAVTSPPGSFPWTVLHERHPALLRQVLDTQPYPPSIRAAVEALADEIERPIEDLPPDDPGDDTDFWHDEVRPYVGRSWSDVPFLWAENYFYRRLLVATGWFGPGPWRGIDPFGVVKGDDLRSAAVDTSLASLDDRPADLDGLLLASVWGNRADLGFLLQRADAGDGHLLVDDRPAARQLLDTAAGGQGAIVADNAGRELLPDLLLADHLLARGTRVTLHVKARPYFVSDATVADVVAALHRLTGFPGGTAAPAAGRRLTAALADGRFAVRAHPFWTTPGQYADLPADLRAELATAAVTVFKGDLNYRRLVGDEHHPATAPFGELTSSLPGGVIALRTLKSDVVVGLDQATLDRLDPEDGWRTSGSYAVVQVAH